MAQWKVIDLFAGIGGFHYAFERAGAQVVFASEIDRFARQAYEANHRASSPELFEQGHFAGDIREVASDEIPAFDIIAGGFPCLHGDTLVPVTDHEDRVREVSMREIAEHYAAGGASWQATSWNVAEGRAELASISAAAMTREQAQIVRVRVAIREGLVDERRTELVCTPDHGSRPILQTWKLAARQSSS
jgi:hypothetical protein